MAGKYLSASLMAKLATSPPPSQRLSVGMTASLKGRLLAKAELPRHVADDVTRCRKMGQHE